MSSLTTKANKSRSAASPKLAAKSSKKTVKKEAKRPLTTKPSKKTAKTVIAKAGKQKAVSKKPSMSKVIAKAAPAKRASAKKAPAKKAVAAKKVSPKGSAARGKIALKGKPKLAASKKVASRGAGKAVRPVEGPAKKVSTPNALAAVSLFEQALKLFNKHEFSAAREAFARILQKFNEQTEIIVSVRKYLAVCEQKLARTPATPKNPDALYDQGVFELNNAHVREAIQLFEKALKTQPEADHILYSLAAAYARTENPRKSLETLRRAIHLQPVHRSRARSDQDFASLHSDDDFQNLTGYGLGFFED